MQKALLNTSAEIVLSCLSEKYLKNEVMLKEHCFVRIISGELKVILANTSRVFGPKDTIIFPRRQLSTVIQYPKDNKPYKCVLIMFKSDRLHDYYSRNSAYHSAECLSPVISFEHHALIENYFTSLLSYFDLNNELPEQLLQLKIDEALTILRMIDASVDTFLADFSEPGKIDLEEFMDRNYMFNMPLEKFSYLTGRSLTTFKRDFNKIYGLTPQRWLTLKRLNLAYYLLSEHKQNPIKVYREAGFENLSHFSYAFKKQFGYSPKHILHVGR